MPRKAAVPAPPAKRAAKATIPAPSMPELTVADFEFDFAAEVSKLSPDYKRQKKRPADLVIAQVAKRTARPMPANWQSMPKSWQQNQRDLYAFLDKEIATWERYRSDLYDEDHDSFSAHLSPAEVGLKLHRLRALKADLIDDQVPFDHPIRKELQAAVSQRDEPTQLLRPAPAVRYDDGMQPGDSTNVPKKRVTTKKAGTEITRHRAPSHQPGYERSNRKGGMVGLGVELPKALRDQVVKAADEWEMSKQQYVTALLVAAIAEHKPKPGEPLPLPEAFKGDPDALRRATKLFIAALK